MHFNSFRHTLMILQHAVYGKIKWQFLCQQHFAISPLKSNILFLSCTFAAVVVGGESAYLFGWVLLQCTVMATAVRVNASGGNSYTSCWMQQNYLVPFELFQPLGKGKVTPLRLWSSFSLLNKQIHKQTWQSSRSNTKHFLMFGCRACCTVKLGPIPWVFCPVLLTHSKLSSSCGGRTLCPGLAVWAGIGQTVSLGSRRHCHVPSSHPGDDAASSCSTLHHCKHGETLPKSTDKAHRWH